MPYTITETKPELLPAEASVRFNYRNPPRAGDGHVVIMTEAAKPARVEYCLGRDRDADRNAVAAAYHEIFGAAAEKGWQSIAVPLCPSPLGRHEVYRIACEEIGRALEEQDVEIYLSVEDEQELPPRRGLLSQIREYIRRHYTGAGFEGGFTFGGMESRRPDEAALPKAESQGPVFGAGAAPVLPESAASAEDKTPAGDDTGPVHKRRRSYKKAALAENLPEEAFLDALPCPSYSFSQPDEESAESEETTLFSAPAPRRRPRDEKKITLAPPFPDDYGVAPPKGELRAAEEAVRYDPQLGTIRLEESFPQAVLRLIDQKGLTDPQCYSRANLSRAVFSKLRQSALNPEKASYRPSKTTALALAVALELDPAEAKELLEKAGYALSHSCKGDIIVEYFLANRMYDIFELNEALFRFGEPLLGSL